MNNLYIKENMTAVVEENNVIITNEIRNTLNDVCKQKEMKIKDSIQLNKNQLNTVMESLENTYKDFLKFKKYTDTIEFTDILYSKVVEKEIDKKYERVLELKLEMSIHYDYEYLYNVMKNWRENKLFIKNLIKKIEEELIELLADLRHNNFSINIKKRLDNLSYHLFDMKNEIELIKNSLCNDNFLLCFKNLENAYGYAKTISFKMCSMGKKCVENA